MPLLERVSLKYSCEVKNEVKDTHQGPSSVIVGRTVIVVRR